ncbi:hypothetical protein AAC387_Pa05g3506 [Persea americana]
MLISAAHRLLATAHSLLAIALLDDLVNAFFALLSQHPIPLHSLRFVYHTLFTSNLSRSGHYPKYRSFIEILNGEPGLWERYVARGDEGRRSTSAGGFAGTGRGRGIV